MLARLIGMGGLLVGMLATAHGKEGPTFYTPERVAAARENVARYDWARAIRDRIMDGDPVRYYVGHTYVSARAYAAQSDDFMWTLQPTTAIPRVYPHERVAVCPVHGTEVRKISPWCPWRIDPIAHPYQIQCALGGEWYPSNDYLHGDMTTGPFADDGSGCLYQGERYYFLREYAHYAYCAITIPALRALSQAYLLTGDRQYGRKGAILLARLASEYPNHEERRDRLFYATTGGRDPHYTWKTGGMITDLIWETFCLEAAVYAYDALYPVLAEDREVLAFVRGKGLATETPAALCRMIEEKLLRAGMKALLSGDIRGNEGHHQAAALACALVLDDYGDTHPNSTDMVEYAFHGAGHAAYLLVNGVTRDGGGHESPGYNRIKLDFIRVNRAMELIRARQPARFPRERYPDLFAGEKARALFDYYLDLMLLDAFIPEIGDSGGIAAPRRYAPQSYSLLGSENLYAFQRYGDARYARAATRPDGALLPGELFEPYPEPALRAALARPEARLDRGARLLDGYGVAILAAGEGGHGQAASLNYTSLIGHRQHDNLSLELFARGVALLPDLGYPYSWDYRWEWDSHLMAHNTVTVDETPPAKGIGGAARLFAQAGGVQVVTALHDPYPPGYRAGEQGAPDVDLYERTLVFVDVGPERGYWVDLFAVRGGEQHDQSWHGPLVPVQAPPLAWETQEGGTLAGKEVAQFAAFKDRWGRERKDFPAFLAQIRWARLEQPAAWTWNTGLPEGDALRLHLVPVGGPLEVILGRGRSPSRTPDWGLDYLIARRQPAARDRRSLFLTVLDAYQKTPTVQSVRLVSETPLVLEVTREGGVDEISLSVPAGPSRATAARPLGVRVRSRAGAAWVRDVEIGEWAPGQGPGAAQGTLRAVDYAQNRIALDVAPGGEADFAPGRAVRIFNGERSALFRVRECRREGDRCWLTLDQTALLARGPVTEAGDGRLTLDAFLVFANGQREGDMLKPAPVGQEYFAGSWLGEGPGAPRLRGAVQGERSVLYLRDKMPAEELRREYAGKVVSVWQYGVGDRVEAVRVRER